ncbi:MAG: hypothetical protein HY390_03080 [Deltaproteobacteria bacterium]|nr:hypothetical protein [Deltaproteobacteria bacterium]
MSTAPLKRFYLKQGLFWSWMIFLSGGTCALLFVFYQKNVHPKKITLTHFAPMFEKREFPLTYTLIPHWKGEDHRVDVAMNNVGVRDIDWPEVLSPEDQKKFRILVLGDSQTFGVGVSFSKIYAKQLEINLKNQGIPIRVFVAGVPGWNTQDEVRFALYHWKRTQPHVVIMLTLLVNDFDSAYTVGENHRLRLKIKPLKPFFVNGDSQLLEGFAEAYGKDHRIPYSSQKAYEVSHKVQPFSNFSFYPDLPSSKQLKKSYAHQLQKLLDRLHGQSHRLWVLVHSLNRGDWADLQVENVFQKKNIPYLFMSDWIDQDPRKWTLFPYDLHGNERYHSFLAFLIQDYLSRSPIGKTNGVSSHRVLPKKLSLHHLQKQVARWQDETIKNVSDFISFSSPKTMRQVMSSGVEGSQFRAVFKLNKAAHYVRIQPFPQVLPNNAFFIKPLIYLDTEHFQGYLPTVWQGKSLIGKLPFPLPQNALQEIGVVAGQVKNHIFYAFSPLQKIDFLSPGTIPTIVWNTQRPLLDYHKIDGLYHDLWIGETFSIPVLPQKKGLSKLAIELVPISPLIVPLTLTCQFGLKQETFFIKENRAYTFTIPSKLWKNQGRDPWMCQCHTSRYIIPQYLDPKSQDDRHLSLKITQIDFR